MPHGHFATGLKGDTKGLAPIIVGAIIAVGLIIALLVVLALTLKMVLVLLLVLGALYLLVRPQALAGLTPNMRVLVPMALFAFAVLVYMGG
jgi:hypothetical protein